MEEKLRSLSRKEVLLAADKVRSAEYIKQLRG
jgi:hypothetical protein